MAGRYTSPAPNAGSGLTNPKSTAGVPSFTLPPAGCGTGAANASRSSMSLPPCWKRSAPPICHPKWNGSTAKPWSAATTSVAAASSSSTTSPQVRPHMMSASSHLQMRYTHAEKPARALNAGSLIACRLQQIAHSFFKAHSPHLTSLTIGKPYKTLTNSGTPRSSRASSPSASTPPTPANSALPTKKAPTGSNTAGSSKINDQIKI